MEDKEYYSFLEQRQEDKIRLIKLIKKIREKVYAKYKYVVGKHSGMNNSVENDHIRKVSHEFTSFLAELDKEIEKLWLFNIPEHAIEDVDNQSIRHCKNKVVDVVMPTDRDRGTRDYQRKLREAGALADSLEHYFMLGYRLGCGRREMTEEEEKKIEENWEKRCDTDLIKAYIAGSIELTQLLQLALANSDVMNELRERRIL